MKSLLLLIILLTQSVIAGTSGFYNIVSQNDPWKVRAALRLPGLDLNQTGTKGSTPLFLAATKGYTEIVDIIVNESWADINLQNDYGFNPLLIAAKLDRTNIAILLLTQDEIDPNIQSNKGMSSLMFAVMRNNIKIASMITEFDSIDLNLVNDQGLRAYDYIRSAEMKALFTSL